MTARALTKQRGPSFEELEKIIRAREEAIYEQGFEDGLKATKVHYEELIRELKRK